MYNCNEIVECGMWGKGMRRGKRKRNRESDRVKVRSDWRDRVMNWIFASILFVPKQREREREREMLSKMNASERQTFLIHVTCQARVLTVYNTFSFYFSVLSLHLLRKLPINMLRKLPLPLSTAKRGKPSISRALLQVIYFASILCKSGNSETQTHSLRSLLFNSNSQRYESWVSFNNNGVKCGTLFSRYKS